MEDYKKLDQSVVDYLKALGQRESSNNPNASSENSRKEGSIGRFQYMPDTFNELGQKYFGGKSLNGQPLNINDDSHQKLVAYAEVMDLKKQGYRPDEISAIHNMGLQNFKDNNGYAKELGAKRDWRGVNSLGVPYDTIEHVKKINEYYKQYRQESKAKENQTQQIDTTQQTEQVPQDNSLLAKTSRRFGRISDALSKFDAGKTGLGQGEITAPELGLVIGANVAGVAGDVGGKVIEGGLKTVQGTVEGLALPVQKSLDMGAEGIYNNILGPKAKIVADKIGSVKNNISNSIEQKKQSIINTVGKGFGALKKGYENMLPERIRQNIIEPTVDVGGTVANLTGAGEVLGATKGLMGKAISATKAPQYIESKAIDQLTNVNRKTLNIPRVRGNKELLAGKDSARFGAERGIPMEVVDGKFNAEPAVKEIFQQVTPKEEVLSGLLKENGNYISLDDYAEQAKKLARTNKNIVSGDLRKIEEDINTHVFNLKETLRQLPDGVVVDGPNVRVRQDILNDIKGENWAKSRFDLQTTNEFRQAQKSLGKSAQSIIEKDNPSVAIKKLNGELGDYYNLLDIVTSRNGAKVANSGTLNKLFNKATGLVIGSQAGVLPAILGATTADTIVSTIQNLSDNAIYQLRKSFIQSGGESKLFDDAIKTLELQKVERLSRPQLPPASPLGSVNRPIPMGGVTREGARVSPDGVKTAIPTQARVVQGENAVPVFPTKPETGLVPQPLQLPEGNKNLVHGETMKLPAEGSTNSLNLGTSEIRNANIVNPSDRRKLIQKGFNNKKVVNNIIKAHKENGGSTINPRTGENLIGTDNYSVSIFPERSLVVDGNEITPEQINQFINNNTDLFRNNKVSLGTWYNPAEGKTYIDAVVTVPKEKAIKLGQKYNQISIFGLKNFDEINTGGTGTVGEFGSIEKRLKEINGGFGSNKK